MAARSYIPQLRFVLELARKYMVRYQTQLQINLTEPQYTCLVDSITAIQSCLNALGERPAE